MMKMIWWWLVAMTNFQTWKCYLMMMASTKHQPKCNTHHLHLKYSHHQLHLQLLLLIQDSTLSINFSTLSTPSAPPSVQPSARPTVPPTWSDTLTPAVHFACWSNCSNPRVTDLTSSVSFSQRIFCKGLCMNLIAMHNKWWDRNGLTSGHRSPSLSYSPTWDFVSSWE